MQPTLRVLFANLFVLSSALGAQEMILEVPADSTRLRGCQMAHSVQTCEYMHIDYVSGMYVGAPLRLNGRPYVLEGMGPGYYLESGVILQPVGDGAPGLEGQRWTEVHPQAGRIYTSRAWKDIDGNQALSSLDTLVLDEGGALKVKDVRLLVRVKPAPEQP